MANSTRLVGLKKDNDLNKQLYDELFVSDSGYRLISSSPKVFSAIHPEDFGDNFSISEEELDYYIDGFIEAVTDNVDTLIESAITEDANQNPAGDSGLDDFDVKLSLYRSFKSLNDKWIVASNPGAEGSTKYFYDSKKNVSGTTATQLFEYFSFVNRCGNDIGKKAVIDFSYLSNLASTQNGEGPTKTLYESITGVLSKNNFDFFPLPSFVTYSEEDLTPLTDMFRAMDGPLNVLGSSPNFVCMFIGGSSRHLDIPRSYCGNYGTAYEYTSDSFDINEPTTYPEDFKEGGTISAFKVRYGQEAQNHFSRVELDQAEFKETQDSLMVIDALTNPSSGSDPTQIGKGNNIYDVNLTRSYTCTVDSLGNSQIQPMMFFKLENVPMFRGTYLITDVNHSITPHSMKTTFKGVRQPIVTVPLVTEALSLLDLALVEIAPPQVNQENLGGSGDQNPNLDDPSNTQSIPASQSLAELLKKAGYKEGNFDYEFALVIGTKEGYKKGSTNRPSRNNNPGNLNWSSSEFSSFDPGAVLEPVNAQGKREFAKFSTPELGAKALVEFKIKKWGKGNYPATLTNGCKKDNEDFRKQHNIPNSLSCIGGKKVKLTIEQFVYIYAPPNENNTERYINQVVSSLKKKYPEITRNSIIIDYLSS